MMACIDEIAITFTEVNEEIVVQGVTFVKKELQRVAVVINDDNTVALPPQGRNSHCCMYVPEPSFIQIFHAMLHVPCIVGNLVT